MRFDCGPSYSEKCKAKEQWHDWLVSDDDGEDSFHERLVEDLKDVSSSAKKVGII